MYLTNKSFYQIYLSSLPAKELFALLHVIDQLLQHYGPHQLVHPTMLKILKAQSPLVFTLVTLLLQHKKCTKKTLKMLKQFAQAQSEWECSHFTISSPSQKVNTSLEKQFKKQFKKSDFSLLPSEDIALQVKGGDLRYERSLDKDLKKIFEK